ncbi:hypothetical protein [Paraliomyxa miuraensis]|uniref:hypothetical protein n=1 Tax=Paraliomyxa miuraensis TaxID=376150 RepID=UPI00224F9102|nr:hypothetical protein [Paraliomyxa miuraensis]MCX4244174.1 hypothetical protein [Paraliomyxa miuraensis]
MIVVSGTRRAGTSMWMQILVAAGLPVIGEAFPGNWEQSLRQANPHGFHESLLRHGVYYRTNPHPITGEYVRASDARGHAVKVFLPGLVRTDAAYLDRVIVTVRPWREYEASLHRLHVLDERNMRSDRRRARAARLRMPPALEWWDDHITFLRDLSVRGYACHVQSYDGVLEDPRGVITRTLAWLDVDADVEAAVAAVQPQARTQRAPESDAVAPHVAEVFDAFYEAVHRGDGLDSALIARLNRIHQELEPEIRRQRAQIAAARATPAPEEVEEADAEGHPDDGPFVVLPGEWI